MTEDGEGRGGASKEGTIQKLCKIRGNFFFSTPLPLSLSLIIPGVYLKNSGLNNKKEERKRRSEGMEEEGGGGNLD